MRLILILVSILFSGTSPVTTPVWTLDGTAEGRIQTQRPTDYFQEPDFEAVYNMSTGFDSEIADDIPAALSGKMIVEVTLWMGEWYGWDDPDGVTVNFYQGACPPLIHPFLSITIPWSDWEKELVHAGLATVYRITAALPQPVEILPQMSIGGYVNISWGPVEPFTGLCATEEWNIHGLGEAYLDGASWGYTRWTSTAFYTGIPRDLAYRLLCTP